MASLARIPLGAPGIYRYPDVPLRGLAGVRMDVCAFVGVAPRGPVRVPVVGVRYPDDLPSVVETANADSMQVRCARMRLRRIIA